MVRARLYKTEAIVLRQRRLGEADVIVTLYTPNYGKLEAKAKGVRKTTSRMAGHLQPLTRCALQLAQGRTMEVVAGCQTIEAFPALRQDLERLSRGLYVAELADRMLPERLEGRATYQLLLDILRRLEAGSHLELALRYLEMGLLGQAGFRPELDECLGCGSPSPLEPYRFSAAVGGLLCRRCGANADARPLSANALRVLRLLQRAPWQEVTRLSIPPALGQEVEGHLRAYIAYVLEREVNALAFIERLRRESRGQPLQV